MVTVLIAQLAQQGFDRECRQLLASSRLLVAESLDEGKEEQGIVFRQLVLKMQK